MSIPLHPQVLGTNPTPLDPSLPAIIQNLVNLQTNPFQRVLAVTGVEFNSLQERGCAWLAEHLSEHLQKDVLWVQDGTKDIDRYFLGPPEDFIDGKRMLLNIGGRAVLVFRPQTKKTSPQKDNVKEAKSPVKEKLKRPSNPFLLYRRDYHKLVKAANPGYNNNQISVVLGRAWREEDQETKEKYNRMAEEVKAEFMRAHPDYRYTPRRAGERPRRKKRDTIQPTRDEAMSRPVSMATQLAPELK